MLLRTLRGTVHFQGHSDASGYILKSQIIVYFLHFVFLADTAIRVVIISIIIIATLYTINNVAILPEYDIKKRRLEAIILHFCCGE